MTEEEYRKALAHHDWEYEHSDYHKAYMAGRLSKDMLERNQPVLDPDHKIWNEYAQGRFQVHHG